MSDRIDELQKNLLKKALANQLGHFFILAPPTMARNPRRGLLEWSERLVQEYFKAKGAPPKEIKNNEDALVLDEEFVNKKFYDKSIVDKVSNFFSYRPIQADRKFLIIEDLEKMSEIHSNKLLKIFEEPGVNATILLLNPSNQRILPTIASRAVLIRVNLEQEKAQTSLEPWIKKLGNKNLHQFCEYFKNRPDDEKELARAILDQANCQLLPELLNKTENYLKERLEDIRYNHNNYARLTNLREIYLLASQVLDARSHP